MPHRHSPGVTPRKRARYEDRHPGSTKALKRRIGYEARLKSKYGMSYADYQRMYAIQSGRCAICRTPQARLCVDHCHMTERVRGLLCNRCNSALGFIGENELVAREMVRYIENRCEPAKRKGPVES